MRGPTMTPVFVNCPGADCRAKVERVADGPRLVFCPRCFEKLSKLNRQRLVAELAKEFTDDNTAIVVQACSDELQQNRSEQVRTGRR